jgi:hypothetical protein
MVGKLPQHNAKGYAKTQILRPCTIAAGPASPVQIMVDNLLNFPWVHVVMVSLSVCFGDL